MVSGRLWLSTSYYNDEGEKIKKVMRLLICINGSQVGLEKMRNGGRLSTQLDLKEQAKYQKAVCISSKHLITYTP
jgi:hypothetical protein